MNTLEALGFIEGADEAHQQKIENTYNSESFFEVAKEMLNTLTPVITTEVIPTLEQYKGRWHPLGFMVFPLGVHEKLGSLRLHIWTTDERQKIPEGTGIHDHAWYIASKVIAGVYSDERYETEEVSGISDTELEKDLFRIFKATKQPGLPDALTTDGSIVRVHLKEKVRIEKGGIHIIEPGVFHIPTIADNQLAVTLVLDSPALEIKPRILIHRTPSDPIHNPRPQVTPGQAITAKNSILATI